MAAVHQSITVREPQNIIVDIFAMECLKMCVVMGLALIAASGESTNAAPPPLTGAHLYNQHKRNAANPEVDLTTGLAAGFGGFGPPSTLADFGYGYGFPANTAGFGFDDVTGGFNSPGALLHLSNPYAATAFGTGFDSIGYPFSDSTLNHLQFKTSPASGSPHPPQDGMTYNPAVANAGVHRTRISGLPATEPTQPTAQSSVLMQQNRPNEQRVLVESLNAASAVPLQQSYSAAASVPLKQQTYTSAGSKPQPQSYSAAAFIPQQQSYPVAGSNPQQQSYSAAESVPQQQSYPISGSAPQQQSYPISGSRPQQQSYPISGSAPQQQSYVAVISAPLQQSYPATASAPLQQSYPAAGSVPQQQSYQIFGSVPQQQSYLATISAPLPQYYPAIAPAPLQQSYPAVGSVPQQQLYTVARSVPQQQSFTAALSASPQQSYVAAPSTPPQQSYVAAPSTPPQQSYPATAEEFRIPTYPSPPAGGPPQPSTVAFAPEAGSVPDLILELRPPAYSSSSPSVDNLQNINTPSAPASSYPPADSNNNHLRNDFGLSSAPGHSGPNQVSNGGPLPGNSNNFPAAGSNTATAQSPLNAFYKVPTIPVAGGSNSASNDVPSYYSVPSISYSLTSTADRELVGSTSAHPAAPVHSITETERGVPAANPEGGPSPLYRDTNSIIPGVSYTSSNSISANSYTDSNSIQSSSYTTPGSPNSYNDYKLSTGNFNGDTNSISLNSKRESSTVDSSYKPPLGVQ